MRNWLLACCLLAGIIGCAGQDPVEPPAELQPIEQSLEIRELWSARVGGALVPLVRANHALRALRLPPGDSLVRLAYEPFPLRAGAALSVLALLIAVWLSLRKTGVE